MKIVSLLFITLLLLNFSSEKEMDFGSFTIKAPNNWTYIKENGKEAFIGKIALDQKDTIDFYYGKYLKNIEDNKGFYILNDSVFLYAESDPYGKPNRKLDKFYGKAHTVNFKKLSNVEYSYEMIDNLKAWIATPKKPGIGLTSVQFKKGTKKEPMTFLMSGFNLSLENQTEFLKVIRTIKFKD